MRRQRQDAASAPPQSRRAPSSSLGADVGHAQRRAHRRPDRLAIQRIAAPGSSSTASTPSASGGAEQAADVVGLPTPSSARSARAPARLSIGIACVGRSRQRQAAAMEVEAGDLFEHVRFADDVRHVGPPRKHVGQRRRRGRRHERRSRIRYGPLEQPLDDQPAFGDEQAAALERGRDRRRAVALERIAMRICRSVAGSIGLKPDAGAGSWNWKLDANCPAASATGACGGCRRRAGRAAC